MTVESKPVEYIKRTRRYYQALGFGAPYDWRILIPYRLRTLPSLYRKAR